ncbi:hypothetical protein IFM89_003122 [Coptis chinensis]|uniref:DUF4283 domain-containing protein n=1 Tax=Coptis chinensis TaxID=261450 RepID=A0A835ISV5_9MAGN|nr:hypothetical protein IFM89_003122 [Coptis chinensis]
MASNSVAARLSWSSLFSGSTRTGNTSLKKFVTNSVDDIAEIPTDILNKVRDSLAKQWKIKGSYTISTDKQLFYFKFNVDEDRKQVLEADPIFIAGRLFVELWTDEGLGYVASLIGEPLNMDEATRARTRLSFAKICVVYHVQTASFMGIKPTVSQQNPNKYGK